MMRATRFYHEVMPYAESFLAGFGAGVLLTIALQSFWYG